MLKLLIKKQLLEVFKGYFYDAKKNKMRSKPAIIVWILFFIVIMVGVLGGMFTALSLSLCGPLSQAGVGWLYFLLLSGLAVLLGAFGSVFSTYSGLYLAKDNDLLLSMPIPIRTIITARLANVYLMGVMYSAVVLIPGLIVYWIVAGVTAARVICGVVLFLVVTMTVLILSCLLGWVVAKISLKLKNRSFISVLIALLFIVGYYFFYFMASGLVRDLISNAETYGMKIRGAAAGLYFFGRIGEGDWLATAIFTILTAAVFALIWIAITRSFLSIATSSGNTEKVRYREKTVRQKSAFTALLSKEFARFTSNANYMLNCGLGIVVLPVCGVLLLIKGREACLLIDAFLAGRPDSAAVLLCTALVMITSMNDMATPSVSLEGKSIWIPQSLPVESRAVLRAKASVQLILTGIPMLFAAICAAIIIPAGLEKKLLILILPLVYSLFSALFDTVIGVRMPLLTWTNELAPIKQSAATVIALFSSWGIGVVFAALYLLIGYRLGAACYLLIWTVLFGAVSLVLLRWLDTRGSRLFDGLS